jgi:hypothetical protein
MNTIMLRKAETPINTGPPPFLLPNWSAFFPTVYKSIIKMHCKYTLLKFRK